MVRQLESRKNAKAENCFRVIQFNELIFKYGLGNSDVIVESPSKVGKYQDKNSSIPSVGTMVSQLLGLLGKGFD